MEISEKIELVNELLAEIEDKCISSISDDEAVIIENAMLDIGDRVIDFCELLDNN